MCNSNVGMVLRLLIRGVIPGRTQIGGGGQPQVEVLELYTENRQPATGSKWSCTEYDLVHCATKSKYL